MSKRSSLPPSSHAGFVPGTYQPALDGLRALSIIAVLLFHDDYLLTGGYLGVDVFFVLSGFLITSLLYDEWSRNGGRVDLRAFYLRRALRLFPALACLLLPGLAFVLMFPHASQAHSIRSGVLYSALYVTNWVSARDPTLLGTFNHLWSLCVEEQFYLVWPVLLLGLLLTTRRRLLPVVIACLAVGFALWRSFLFAHGATAWRIYVGTDTRADSLLLGGAVAVAMAHGDLPRLIGGARAARWLALPGAAALVWLLARTPLEWPGYARGGYLGVAVAVALVLLAVLTNPDALATRLLSTPLLVWLGRLSYSLYLWHMPVFSLLRPERFGLPRAPVLLVRLGVALGFACASYYLIERPFLRWKKRLRSLGSARVAGETTGSAASTP